MSRLLTSTVARLVAAIFVLQLAVMLAAILLLRAQMLQVIETDRARQISDVRDDLLAAYYDGGSPELLRTISEGRGGIADPLVFVAVQAPGQAVPAALSNIATVPALAPSPRPVQLMVDQPGAIGPAAAVARTTILPDGARMVIGAFTAPDRRLDIAFAEAFTLTVVFAVLLSLAGAIGIGYIISRRTHSIADTAAALASGNFAARVKTADTADGFDHLRRQINLMAERIDALVCELQSVAGALAHDLRSPVTRLRASIDIASAAAGEGAAAEALALARADAEALDSMLGAALELARLESGAVQDRRTRINLHDVAADLVELYEPLAEQSGVTLSVAGKPCEVMADREMVSRALANLIDNALKYGGSDIVVATRETSGEAMLEVTDNGPGIAPADRARAVERFTRLDSARTRSGAGLGLAMVAAVARLHGGRFELASPLEGRGLTARMVFPRG
ncbi:MAG TPA: ATP-binding protein [Novosphingobium sp.]